MEARKEDSPRTEDHRAGDWVPRLDWKKWVGLGCSLVIGSNLGCTSFREYKANGFKVGPNYMKPAAPVESNWIDAADQRISSEPSDQSHWWSMFNDPVLDNLIVEATAQNLTLREAGFRVMQARALRNIQVGNLFPQTQEMLGSYTRNQISKRNANTSFIPTRFFDQHQIGFNLSWELDFWGRFRRSVEAAEADLDASVEGYDAALVTLQGDIAQTYIEVRTIQRQLTLVRANITLQQHTRDLTEARTKGGLDTQLDLAQAQSTLSQTEALVPQFETNLRHAMNRLCVLLGLPPEDLTNSLGEGPIPNAPDRLVIGIPADLLTRRPDVRRAERLAAAQSARIGIATSDLYPRIAVTGTIGSSVELFSDHLRDEAIFGSVGPSFQWNILNYGRLRNNIRLQDARFQELIASYQQTVIEAEAEAENGIIRFLKARERAAALGESVTAAEKAVELALKQFDGDLVDFNRIAVLEQNLVQQQDLLAQAQGSIAQGLIELFRALGGGWEHRLNPTAVYSSGPPAPMPGPTPAALGIPVPGIEPAAPDEPKPVPPDADGAESKPEPEPQNNNQSSRVRLDTIRGVAKLGGNP